MEVNKIPIKIHIDNDISVNMEIQQEMTADEFQGLMIKAKKLFNISNNSDNMPMPVYKPKKVIGNRIKWTEDMLRILRDNYATKNPSELIAMINVPGVDNSRITSKAFQMGLRKNKDAISTGNATKLFSNSEIEQIVKMYKNHTPYKTMSERIGKTPEQIKNKVKALKNKGVINGN